MRVAKVHAALTRRRMRFDSSGRVGGRLGRACKVRVARDNAAKSVLRSLWLARGLRVCSLARSANTASAPRPIFKSSRANPTHHRYRVCFARSLGGRRGALVVVVEKQASSDNLNIFDD